MRSPRSISAEAMPSMEGVSRRWMFFAAIAFLMNPSCESTIAKGPTRYAYRVSWHILTEMRDIPDSISGQELDVILNDIDDDECRKWALEWRSKNLIYLARYHDSNAVVLDPKSKSKKDGKPFVFVMQKHFESPKSVSVNSVGLQIVE